MKELILVIFALISLYCAGVMSGMYVDAIPMARAADGDAKEVDPVVVPCKKINTATDGVLVISVFLCKPENAAPYKINNLGFMLPENQ